MQDYWLNCFHDRALFYAPVGGAGSIKKKQYHQTERSQVFPIRKSSGKLDLLPLLEMHLRLLQSPVEGFVRHLSRCQRLQ